MADKRTRPVAPQEPRSKKRAAPTIDLTATEVSSAPAADETPPSAAAPPPSDSAPVEAAPEPVDPPAEPPPPAELPPSFGAAPAADLPAAAPANEHWFTAPTLAVGAAGAAMMALVLFALWLTGLVPIRYAGSTATRARVTALEMEVHDLQHRPAGTADAKATAALSDRVAKLEDAIAKLAVGEPGVADKLAAADNAMKSLGVALAALNRRNDDIAANAAIARERAEAAEKAVTDLRASLKDVAKDASAAVAPAELDALQQRIAALEQSTKTARDEIAKNSASDTAARLALGAAALRNAAESGVPFAAELAQARSLGADDKALAPLAVFAAGGLPTQAALAEALRALLPDLLKASGAQAPAGGFLDRLQANAGKLVRIRPLDAPPGDDASALLARIEIAAAHADITAALSALGKLPDATRAPAQDWIRQANARQAALAAARQFAADSARALGQK